MENYKGQRKIIRENLIELENLLEDTLDTISELSIKNEMKQIKTKKECEKEALSFTIDELKLVGSMLSDDYKTGFREGIEKYLKKINSLK